MVTDRDKPAHPEGQRRRGPGRPRRADSGETRGRILDIAVAHFGQNGRNGASVRTIATESGVTLATVLHHFGDKASLYGACVARAHAELNTTRDRFLEVIQAAATPRDAVRPVVQAALSFAFDQRNNLRVVVTDSVMSGQLPDALREELVLPTVARLGEALAAHTDQREAQIRLLAMSLFHLVSRYALTSPRELAAIIGVDPDAAGGEQALLATLEAELEDHLTGLVLGYMVQRAA